MYNILSKKVRAKQKRKKSTHVHSFKLDTVKKCELEENVRKKN